jgi:hypothetical protein
MAARLSVAVRQQTHLARCLVRPACSAAAPGPTARTTCAPRTGSVTRPASWPTTSVFASRGTPDCFPFLSFLLLHRRIMQHLFCWSSCLRRTRSRARTRSAEIGEGFSGRRIGRMSSLCPTSYNRSQLLQVLAVESDPAPRNIRYEADGCRHGKQVPDVARRLCWRQPAPVAEVCEGHLI